MRGLIETKDTTSISDSVQDVCGADSSEGSRNQSCL